MRASSILDALLIRHHGFALWRDALRFQLKLVHPVAQNGLGDANRTARLDMTIVLVHNQACSLLLEIGGKRTSLLAHQTPFFGEYFRLN